MIHIKSFNESNSYYKEINREAALSLIKGNETMLTHKSLSYINRNLSSDRFFGLYGKSESSRSRWDSSYYQISKKRSAPWFMKIYQLKDEWFMVSITYDPAVRAPIHADFVQTCYYHCDQLDGLIQLLSDNYPPPGIQQKLF